MGLHACLDPSSTKKALRYGLCGAEGSTALSVATARPTLTPPHAEGVFE
jgi:hypothetical protein